VNWDEEYAYIIAGTGWTWEYIDEFMTLPRLNAMRKVWDQYPPVNVTAALFAGIKTERAATPMREAANAPTISNREVVADKPLPSYAVKWINVTQE
jgi:hypothetical protein